MNQLTLYTHPHSRGRNVRWMLEECSADYKVIGVPFGAAMKAPEYRAINPDYSVLRVAERVKQGGHNIPEATIRRRFAAGLANLDAYCAAVNHWAVYENTADRPALPARWHALDTYADRAVCLHRAHDTLCGTNRGIDEQGRLLLETADGISAYSEGETRLRPQLLSPPTQEQP